MYGLRFQLPRKSQGSFTCHKSATLDRRLYFPSEGRHAEDFFRPKYPTASAGFLGYSCTLSHSVTHTRTRTHAHARACTHTHTHTRYNSSGREIGTSQRYLHDNTYETAMLRRDFNQRPQTYTKGYAEDGALGCSLVEHESGARKFVAGVSLRLSCSWLQVVSWTWQWTLLTVRNCW
jgi:hypothetical protein